MSSVGPHYNYNYGSYDDVLYYGKESRFHVIMIFIGPFNFS